MHNKKLFTLFVALLVTMQTAQAKRSWPLVDFDDIEAFFNRQFEEFNQRIEDMHNARIKPTLTLAIPMVTAKATIPVQSLNPSITETNEHLIISVPGISSEDLTAQLNDANTVLTICSSEEKIEIELENNYLQLEIRLESRHQKNKNGSQTAFFGTSSSVIGQSVSGDPVLGNQTIEYDTASSTLTITIPKQAKIKQGKIVPIAVKTANAGDEQQDETENE
jgi:HSP20 family molecular chaperone IbpA